MKKYSFDAVIIGSGCAGYNCADWLYDYGVKNIALITEGKNTGTSRNTGSDKQTYYKLSLAGDEADGVMEMAKTLFSGGAMDGDLALVEAANSVRSFIKLANLGVKFPTNEYGEFVGYKTDHDPYRRATSVGPYTSKRMTEALENSVKSKNITVLDNCQAIKILKNKNSVVGLLAIDLSVADKTEYVAVESPYVVLATGGPASVYKYSVYPECHTGSSALALDAGAEFSNLCEWQYGLASVDFRWNVSGTYQQVLPRYISIDENGVEREFLTEYFDSADEMLKNVFLKGYEWPFDVRKLFGSSFVDLAVYNETMIKNRKVYLDFTREPTGLENGFDGLDKTAYEYLKNSDALISLPINRLKKMNAGAISLYKDHGIDIQKEPLAIAVCAQHNNGGVSVNADYESSVSGLYVIGEAAGVFGIFRPGGSALNSTQVGGLRAARHIYLSGIKKATGFEASLSAAVAEFNALFDKTKGNSTVLKMRESYQKRMSKSFAFLRSADDMAAELRNIYDSLERFADENKWEKPYEIPQLLKNFDVIMMSAAIAASMSECAAAFGSRGSSYVLEASNDFMSRRPVPENEEGRSLVITAKMGERGIVCGRRKVRPIPERELWFEKVWNGFRG